MFSIKQQAVRTGGKDRLRRGDSTGVRGHGERAKVVQAYPGGLICSAQAVGTYKGLKTQGVPMVCQKSDCLIVAMKRPKGVEQRGQQVNVD